MPFSYIQKEPLPVLTEESANRLLEAARKEIDIPKDFEFILVIVNNAEIQALNKEYRKKDYPTDVLSFPYGDNTGEIIISADKVREQAKEYRHSEEEEIAFLVVHGIVHIMGWDHERSEEEAKEQRDIEKRIVQLCGFGYAR